MVTSHLCEPCVQSGRFVEGQGSTRRCLAHLTSDELEKVLASARLCGSLDGRGVVFTRALLDRVLSVASIAHAGQRILGDADFTDATFAEHANFSRCSFAGNARFAKTDWLEGADFSSTRFGRAASFAGAKFAGGAVFAGAQFSNEADFSGSAFVESSGTQGPWLATVLAEGGVSFRQAIFGGNATFVDVQVGWADFSEARFKTECTFRGRTL